METMKVLTVCAVQVAAKALEAAAFGAYYNIMTNLTDVTDEAFKAAVRTPTSAGSLASRQALTSGSGSADTQESVRFASGGPRRRCCCPPRR